MAEVVLEARDLAKHFGSKRGLFGRRDPVVKAVDGVSLDISRDRTLGLVGESGCGKSTLGLMLVGLMAPSAGSIRVEGKEITPLSARERLALHARVQFVFQDPSSSLNPRRTVAQTLEAPLKGLLNMERSRRRRRVEALMDLVGLRPEFIDRYPHEFSGGQRQRIAIARALAAEPEIIVLDEPVSALDVSIQAQVLSLLKDLQARLGVGYLFISHDLAVVEALCHQVAVMYLGRIVEYAPRDELFDDPRHPYTRVLMSSVPIPGHRRGDSIPLKGDAQGGRPAQGCAFEPRCYRAEAICKTKDPRLEDGPVERPCACWFANNSAPRG